MKTCTHCNQLKLDTEFAWRNKSKNKRHAHCRACQKSKSRKWYKLNCNKHAQHAKKNTDRYRKRNRDYIWNYLSANPCVDCGEADPIVLEFDHREPKDKKCHVYDLVRSAASLKKLGQEIAKCDIRCANCHRRKTALQLGWWFDKLL